MLPLGKSLAVGQAGNWRFEWAAVMRPSDEEVANRRINRRWMNPFDIPVLIESTAIAVKCSLASAPPTWNSAGTLLRSVPFPGNQITLEDDIPGLSPAITDRRSLRLNSDFEILLFNQSASELRLTFIPKPWLTSVGMTIYSYVGPITDEVLEELSAVRAKLELIDAQVGG